MYQFINIISLFSISDSEGILGGKSLAKYVLEHNSRDIFHHSLVSV